MTSFRSTFHESGIPQAILTLDGYVIEANEALCNLLLHRDLCGEDFQALKPEGSRMGGFPPTQHLVGTRAYLAHEQFERSDGVPLWTNTYYSAVYEDGRLGHILAQVIDLSHERELEHDLQTKQVEIDQFASIASHDLREPLSTIAGYATLIQKKYADLLPEQGVRWLEEIISGTERMGVKVDDLLAFSRAGRCTPKSEFPLGAAVEEGKRALTQKLRETKGSIVVEGELPLVEGDRSMIAQVFQNLFSNSLKYRGDSTPHITVRAEQRQGICKISVSDNGLGFDSSQYGQRVFEVFQRLYTVDKYPGTGIGLAITKKIIERHGGTISVQSSPGQGATFTFTLPKAS